MALSDYSPTSWPMKILRGYLAIRVTILSFHPCCLRSRPQTPISSYWLRWLRHDEYYGPARQLLRKITKIAPSSNVCLVIFIEARQSVRFPLRNHHRSRRGRHLYYCLDWKRRSGKRQWCRVPCRALWLKGFCQKREASTTGKVPKIQLGRHLPLSLFHRVRWSLGHGLELVPSRISDFVW